MLLGVPDFTSSHVGIDRLGARCRVDSTVSVMRFGPSAERLCLADDVSIYEHVRLVLGDVAADPGVGIQIGPGTIVNVGSYLSGEGGLSIGTEVLIGAHAKLLSAGHAIDGGDIVIARNAITRGRIVVDDGAWIGAGATVLEGVRIGRGAVVAAGAVVRQDVPEGMVAVGVPARIVRPRRMGAEPVRTLAQQRDWVVRLRAAWRSFRQP